MEQTVNLDNTTQSSIIHDQNNHHKNKVLRQEEEEEEEEEENFNEDFQCCVCLDLLYKPVVLACGHLSCFWCVYKAMNFWHESHCPICRNPYNHFPNVCQLLHLLLLKLYPVAYKRRRKQVEEEEKSADHFSPEVNDRLFASHPYEALEPPKNDLELPTHSTKRESPYNENSEKAVLHGDDNAKSMPSTSSKSCKRTTTSATEKFSLRGSELESKTEKRVSVTDLLCAECKKLLCHPVVLNCGHVYCESCIIVPEEGIPRCPICQSLHSNGMPSVCFVLEHFLQELFSHEYAERINCLPKDFNGSKRIRQLDKQSPKFPSHLYSSWLFGGGPKVHIGCGCDSCGMTPIIGKRYRCKDCVEKIGFDLCESCYINPSKLLGRFNQRHKPCHNFEIVPPPTFNELLSLLNVQLSDEDDADAPEEQEDGFANPNLLGNVPMDLDDGSNNMEDVSSAEVLCGDVASGQENGSREPNSSDMRGEDREDTQQCTSFD